MFRYGMVWRVLLTLLLVGVLIGAGVALYRYGWAQGYQAGAIVANNGNRGSTPQLPYSGYPPYYYYPGFGAPFFFFPFGPLLGLGAFLLVFFLIGGLFRFGRYRRWGWQNHPDRPGGWERREQPEQENKEEK